MAFNENTRVKIPAILHLCRLGYKYLSLAKSEWDIETNIFRDVFFESIKKINPEVEDADLNRLLQDITLMLDNEDLGEAFYQRLISTSGIRLLDLSTPENFKKNNSFHVVTELTCKNGDEEFRPDITLLVNGMPLAFIEVKKPNNQEGVLAERDRINARFKNKKFRKFITNSNGVGGMIKRAPGYDPAHGDWEYFYFEKPEKIERGRIATCVKCHAYAHTTDHVYGTWRLK